MTTIRTQPNGARDRVTDDLLRAAHEVLEKEGPGAMTVRAIATQAGISTMAVYSRFGCKAKILEALYRRGFELLREELEKVPASPSSVQDITALGFAYRRFALDHPGLYGFMFERPLPGFDPTLESRQDGLQTTFYILVDRVEAFIQESMGGVGEAVLVSYLIWSAVHGRIEPGTHPIGANSPGRVARQRNRSPPKKVYGASESKPSLSGPGRFPGPGGGANR